MSSQVRRWCVACLVLGLAHLALAEPFALTSAEEAWLAEHPDIRVGVMDDFPPFHFTGRTGEPTGLGIDLLEDMNRLLGGVIRIQPGPFHNHLDRIRRGELDAVMDATPGAGRDGLLILTQPYQTNPEVIVAKRGGRFYRNARMLSGASLALERGFGTVAWFQANYPKVRLRLYDTTADALDGVARGEAVAYAGNRAVALNLLEREMLSNMHVQGRLDKPPSGLAIGIRQGELLLAALMDRALEEVLRTQGRAIQSKWFRLASHAGGRLDLTEDQQAWLEAIPRLRVGILHNAPPLNFVDDEGRPRGIGVDLIELLNERLDGRIDVVPGDRAFLHAAIREGRIEARMDFAPGAGDNDLLPTKPYANIPPVIIARREGRYYDTLRDLRKQTVALEEGSPLAAYLRAAHPRIRQVEHATIRDALAAVSAGQAEAYVGSRAVATWLIARDLLSNLQIHGTVRGVESVTAIGVRPDLPELVGILNAVMASLSAESVQAIYEQWGGAGWSRGAELSWVQLTPEEKLWLEENPVIRVGSNPRWAPLEFTDVAGAPKGIAWEYLDRFGQALGVKFLHVAIPSWRQAQAKLRDEEIDLLTSLNRASARRTEIEFTPPFLALPTAIFTHENTPFMGHATDLRGKTAGVVIGYGLEDYLRTQVPGLQVEAIRNVPVALKMLESGELDAYVGSLLVTSHYIQRGGHARLKVAGEIDFVYHPAFAARADSKILVQILAKALAGLDDREKNAIAREWMAVTFEKRIDYTKLYKWAAGVLGLMALFAYWNRRMAAEIRRRRVVEASLRTSEEAQVAANKELEAFSYSVSHDLRAPLRHVSGFVQLLQSNTKGRLDETGERYLDIISGAAKRMGELIDDLLSFSRTGRAQMTIESVPLGPLVDECKRELELELRGRTIEWQIGALPEVRADRPLLRQVMANLLGNAVKYSGKRDVARIEVSARQEDGEIVVGVRDNGAGFDMQYADKLFGVFQRLHAESEFEGTGIGLANVRRIIVRHGGRTWAQGEVDKGAAFYFSLPCSPSESPPKESP